MAKEQLCVEVEQYNSSVKEKSCSAHFSQHTTLFFVRTKWTQGFPL